MQQQPILLVFNRASGTGHGDGLAARLQEELARTESALLQTAVVDNHAAARNASARFLRSAAAPATIIVAGGGGTLRAALEGICDACGGRVPSDGRVSLAALRLGSGNVIARALGVPLDPVAAIRGIAANLGAGRVACCSTIRVEAGAADGTTRVCHALTLGGLGQFGRVPGDLARWHRRLPAARRLAARAIPLEKLTNAEYAAAMAARLAACAVAWRCEEVEVACRQAETTRVSRLRLLAGFVLNFRVSAIPIDPGVGLGECAVAVHLVPLGNAITFVPRLLAGRVLRGSIAYRLQPGDALDIRLLDRDSAPFFLDEDAETAYRALRVEVGGMIPFVPGSEARM